MADFAILLGCPAKSQNLKMREFGSKPTLGKKPLVIVGPKRLQIVSNSRLVFTAFQANRQ
jgi:hypothetical protein